MKKSELINTIYEETGANSFRFNINSNTINFKEQLRLDEKGFYYNGQFIEDAGLAYGLFMEWLTSAEAERGA